MTDIQSGSGRSITLPAGRIAALRRERLLTQSQLVEACVQRRLYVSIATLKRAEGGHSVSLRTASDLARFFGIALPELLGGVAPVAPPPPNWSETRTLPLVRLAQPATTALVAQLAAAGGRPLDESGLHFVFGVDVAGCDSPVHVAHVLLDLQSQHSGLGARLDYGDIVCDGQGFRGARLQHAAVAVAGEIRTSSAVHAVLSDTLLFERCGEDWRVLGCVPSQLPQSPRLVGRALEWQRLSAGIEAGAGGVASLVLLRGGIGVGKSRLAGECALHAQATGYACHVLHAGLTRGGDDTLSQRLVLRLAGAGPNRAIHGWSLEHQALLHSLRGEALSPLMQGMRNAMNPARVQQLLDELLIGLFKQHAAVRPQLLVIEDAHGASEGFWSSLIGALAALAAYPVLVVATLRHGGALAAEVAARAATACVPCLTQDLSPLSTGDARILAAQLGYAEHPHLEQCIARAAGNPLFLACLLPQQPAGEGDLPASLRAAVQAELARLAPTERYALGVMAVAGEGCPADLVQQVGGVATGSWPLLAVRYGEVWRFSSALVREVLYQQMTAATRVALHRRLADWYRERDAVACARHLALGGEPRALDELLAAARIECDTLRDERALGLLDMARALPASARQSSVLHTLLAELQLRRGKPSLAIMHGKLAVEQAAGAPAWQARLIGIEALLQLDRLDEALAALAQMDEELGAAAEPLLRARLHVLRGRAYFPRNRISESAAAQQQALEYARTAGDFALQARARSGLGDAAYAQGDFAGAQAQFQSCLALCGSYGLLPEQAANRAALASVLFYLGEVTASLEEALYSLDIARRIGHRRAEAFSTLVAGWVLLDLDEADAAGVYLRQGRQVAEGAGLSRFLPMFDEAAARAAYELGDAAGALTHARAACSAVDAGQLHLYVGPWALATCAAFSPVAERAVLLTRAADTLEDSMYHNRLQYHARLIEQGLREADWTLVARQATVLADTRSDLAWVRPYLPLSRLAAAGGARAVSLGEAAQTAYALGYLALARRLRVAAAG